MIRKVQGIRFHLWMEDETCLAQGLDRDIATHGEDVEEALASASYLVQEQADWGELTHIPPAPAAYWFRAGISSVPPVTEPSEEWELARAERGRDSQLRFVCYDNLIRDGGYITPPVMPQ